MDVIEMKQARKKLSRTEWKTVIRDWERSGLSQKEYCKRNDLLRHTFSWWKWHPSGRLLVLSFLGFRRILGGPKRHAHDPKDRLSTLGAADLYLDPVGGYLGTRAGTKKKTELILPWFR